MIVDLTISEIALVLTLGDQLFETRLLLRSSSNLFVHIFPTFCNDIRNYFCPNRGAPIALVTKILSCLPYLERTNLIRLVGHRRKPLSATCLPSFALQEPQLLNGSETQMEAE